MQHNDGQPSRVDSTGLTSVAATVAVLALGVGAFWKCSSSLSSSSSALLSVLSPSPNSDTEETPVLAQDEPESLQDKERREKTRSKDRRKRNKDPLLEVVKGGKRKGSKKANLMAQALLSSKTDRQGHHSDAGNPQSEDEPFSNEMTEAGSSESSTGTISIPLPSTSSSIASLSDSVPSVASSSQSRPPMPTADSSKSNKTIKAPATASEHRSPPVFPGPWESMPDLKAELEHSRKVEEEKLAARSKSRGDVSLKDPSSAPAILPQPPPLPTKRSDTPASMSSVAPEVSTQTQFASLRGALEAARLREEKAKVDMEKAMKEVEAARWENANWRRRELEMQSQIAHLAHQLQSYAAMFASMSYHSSPSRPPLSQNSSMSSPPPNMMSSPLAQFPQSPYFTHLGPTTSASHPTVLYATSSSSRSSDDSELAPESPSPPLFKGERGRQRTRAGGPKTSPPLDGEGAWHTIAPSLSLPLPLSQLHFPSSLSDGSNEDENDEDAGFSNDALADAILKNPEFMKLPSPTKKRRVEPEEPQDVETLEVQDFEFPSLNSGYCAQPQRHTPQPQEQDES